MSATVVGPDAAQADALATALCILGPEAGLELIEGIERTEALVVGMDGKVQLSSGLK
jgi:thiamine biosynthesis lipoprotein